MTLKYTPVNLTHRSGYIQTTIPEDFREDILREINEVRFTKKNPMNDKLVGIIQEEYALPQLSTNTQFLGYMRAVSHMYCRHFEDIPQLIRDLVTNDPILINREDYWVNFQKKYEYNPVHSHSGIFSFVIWIEIPYDLQEEKEFFKTSKKDNICNFSFVYDSDGVVCHYIDVNKSYEWEMIMFPSSRRHAVTPFLTSDGERISIAGNLTLDN